MVINQEIVNRMGVTRGTSTFSNAMGRSVGDDKTDVMEEGAIRDESAGGPMSVHGRRV